MDNSDNSSHETFKKTGQYTRNSLHLLLRNRADLNLGTSYASITVRKNAFCVKITPYGKVTAEGVGARTGTRSIIWTALILI